MDLLLGGIAKLGSVAVGRCALEGLAAPPSPQEAL